MKNRVKQVLILSMVLMLILTGCVKEEAVVQEEIVVQEEAEIVVEEVTEPEEPQEEIEEIPLSVHTTTNYKTYYLDESDEAYLYLQYCDVVLEGSGFENLKRNVENWSMERSEAMRSSDAELRETALNDAKENGDFFNSYTLYQTISTKKSG